MMLKNTFDRMRGIINFFWVCFFRTCSFRRCAQFTFLAFALGGCSPVSIQSNTPAEQAIDQSAQQSRTVMGTGAVNESSPAPPREVESPVATAPAAPAAPAAERFDVSVEKVPAKSFFLGLVSGTGTNIVVHPDLTGTISLELSNVTIAEVLDVTRDIYGYDYRFSKGIYTLYPRKLSTQIYPINYIDVQRVGISETSVLVGKISSAGDNNRRGGSSVDVEQQSPNLLSVMPERGQGNGGGALQVSGITPGSRVQTLTKTDFWSSLRETILAIIDGGEGERMVMVNPQAGMVVVKAMPDEQRSVRNFLERSELSVKRQVVLETKILEVRLNDEFDAGINWGAIGGQILLSKNVGEFQSPSSITLASESVGEVFASLIKVTDISELLSLLEMQGSVQVLSSPRVSTVNNQKAIIRVGSDEFFVTGISSQTTSNASAIISTPNIELSSFFSGIALDVTPQIAESGEVILHIHPVVSDVKDQLKDITVGDEQFSLPLALRDIRESDSIVRARNGQVVVLGGLMQETLVDNRGKRPLIGDIPLINALFRSKEKRKVKTELVILLRPMVVDEQTWSRQVDTSREWIHSLGDEYRSSYK